MEPTIELWSRYISSAAQASQYPPDAATSSTNAITFFFFFFAFSIIESAIKEDCVGDPPGEFIIKATAGLFLSENNLSINLLTPWSDRPERKIPAWPITPDNLRVGIVTDLLKKNDFKYDVLISYYRIDNIDLNLVTAKSKANFKIGISNFDQRLNDFIIDVGAKHIDVFRNELEKYLKGLNKIL